MKIIDLLNKIANGEEVPQKFIWNDKEYYLQLKNCYRCDETSTIFEDDFVLELLNDEVEIIEEEKKIPEKMDRELNCDDDTLRGLVASVNEIYKEIADKYNEIIDYLKSKGEE